MKPKPLLLNLASLLASAVLMLCAWAPTSAQAQANAEENPCGPIANHYGPFDYRTQHEPLKIVEKHHFTPQVEGLIRGQETYIGGDLNYTLHTSPNHHRALVAMMRLFEKTKGKQPEGVELPLECYLERAIRFAPDDTVVRVLYVLFLSAHDRAPEALLQLNAADFYAKDNGFSHYNIGMAYAELRDYENALIQAHKAMSLGFDRQGLADLLKSVGKWQDPPLEPGTPPAAAASAPEVEAGSEIRHP